jgi:hypothetical protein
MPFSKNLSVDNFSELEVTVSTPTKFQHWKHVVTFDDFQQTSLYAMKSDSNEDIRMLKERDDRGS